MPYSGNPDGSPEDAVRFLLQDTSTSEQITDAELNWLLSQNGSNVYKAAALGAELLASKFRNAKTKTVGALSITYDLSAERYADLAKRLRAQIAKGLTSTIVPYSGGISKLDKELNESDTDWDKPFFTRKQFDHIGADMHRPELSGASTST